MGVVFQSNGHKTAYIMGDTVWTADVNKALNRYKPDYLIMEHGLRADFRHFRRHYYGDG